MHTLDICSEKFNLSSIVIPSTFILSIENIIVLPTGSASQLWDEISIGWNFSGFAFKEFCLNQFIKTLMSFVKKCRMVSIVSLE